MDYRRFVTFLVVCFSFSYLYTNFVLPQKPAPVLQQPPGETNGVESETEDDQATETSSEGAEISDNDSEEAPSEDPDKGAQNEIISHPARTAQLGSNTEADQFAIQAILSSRGASIESVTLTDPRFKELEDKDSQVQVIGDNSDRDQTMALAVDYIDEQLAKDGKSLETAHWELISESKGEVVFAFDSPDGELRVQKAFTLQKLDVSDGISLQQAFNRQPQAYTIETEVKLVSQSDSKKLVQYELQGPVGVVLENVDHTRKYRDIKLEFFGDDDAVTFPVSELKDAYTDSLAELSGNPTESDVRAALRQSEAWTGMFRYVGVDVQFFAALISTLDDRTPAERLKDRWIERIYPMMVRQDPNNENLSDLSFRLVSTPISLQGDGKSVAHRFAMFVGPKRRDLLEPEPFVADQVLDYGWWFGFIARIMHSLLDTFHSFGMPYFLAIISLTVLVRGMMFPISRKQAVMAAKQKALAPKLNELKLKYGDDKEKMARAQMELWRKHGINPLGGCLPIFVQFPVFIALYTCLNTAVDLRLAEFLWVDNLAAPDALFKMPTLPFLGSDFNLLPCITVVLFLIQQKLFMPPPADEQAEMTQKMMNFMTIGMGLMFWHVPAGLCIYFIASSLWGIAERKLLRVNTDAPVESSVTVRTPGAETEESAPKKQGFFARKMEAAQEKMKELQEQAERAQQDSSNSRGGSTSKGKKSGRNTSKGGRNKRKGR